MAAKIGQNNLSAKSHNAKSLQNLDFVSLSVLLEARGCQD